MDFWLTPVWAASVSLAIAPFGTIEHRLRGDEVWRGVDSTDSVFLLVRAQRSLVATDSQCRGWVESLRSFRYGSEPKADFAAWSPWNEEETKAVRDCKKSPCKVKLAPEEAAELARSRESDRLGKYLKLISERLSKYRSQQERRRYEAGSSRMDPWASLQQSGFQVEGVAPPAEATFSARILNLNAQQIRPIRQVIDQRFLAPTPAAGSGLFEAHLWARDVYSAHYFDAWGERLYLRCDPRAGQAVLVHALSLDFDVMRKTDFVTKLARPRLRAAIREMGSRYLDGIAERLTLNALAGGTPESAPVPTGSGSDPKKP